MRSLFTGRVVRLLALTACFYLAGGHWLVLQCAGWAGMLISFASTRSVAEAVEMTFDGENPCQLCKIVDAEVRGDNADADRSSPEKDSKKPQPTEKVRKLEVAVLDSAQSLLDTIAACTWAASRPLSGRVRTESPETPPPRA